MASTNKTEHLGLNQWIGSDHPTRTDFVQDNSIIDNAVGTHCADANIHLTSAEKARVSNPVTIKQYSGTGATSITVNFAFEPKLVLVQKKNSPPVSYSSSGVVINSGFVTPGYGGTQGLSLMSGVLTLSYATAMTNGARANFNEENAAYIIAAFR
ncbi:MULTISPECIES: hypothetical protein [unclassified Ruminococcus]|uniref:hypothetical protein n=1 Tax=unclassified Ruminococcus TaxID=2608920 RepID=UPI00210D9805|nr:MULTISPECIES: hypothetical protein [unclassified Ruminococcus]MCQ4021537.1 hypothetical protein [Ruminococcus sp. zg-924]MCQ4113982.1 hypothetical protein [Ruminococcus sp. zg-921]